MPFANSGGLRVWWEEEGEGPAIVLVHGYTSNLRTHWKATGWVEHLAQSYRVIALDLRGHGRSDKPIRASAYSRDKLAGDVVACLDNAGIDEAVLFGYSMGAMVGVQALLEYRERFPAAILGGMGVAWPASRRDSCVAEESEDTTAPHRDLQRSMRAGLAWLWHYNPFAMRALSRGMFHGQQPMPAERLPEIRVPVLSVTGTRDMYCPGTLALPKLLPNCRRVALDGQTHTSVVSDPRYKAAVDEFLVETGWR
jgi:pimeloyl-ACP methyl ester carboxylesterase